MTKPLSPKILAKARRDYRWALCRNREVANNTRGKVKTRVLMVKELTETERAIYGRFVAFQRRGN